MSGLAVQRLSDLICLEHQLSVIEIKPYRERQKRTLYPPRESNRDKLCAVIDNILLSEKPASFEGFLQKLEQRGYEIKRGKYTSVKGTRQKRFIRFRTLGAGYSEDEIKAVIAGDAEHCPHQKQPPKEKPFNLLVDVQAKLAEGKNIGYARWAKKYNLKEMSKTLIFLQEKKIGSIEEMQERVDAATARYHELGDSIKAAETRMTEIAVLRTHIVNYTKNTPGVRCLPQGRIQQAILENHRAEITLHKAAKTAFDEAKLKKLPKVKELDAAEYSKLLTEKKAAYPDYRKAKDEMQELLRAQRNVELFFAEEKNTTEKNAVPIDDDNLGFFHCGRVLGCFFVIEVFGNKTRSLHRHDADQNGVWAQPNKHFEFGFEKIRFKNCKLVPTCPACRIDSPVKNLGALLKKDFTEKRSGSGDWPQIGLIFAGFWCTACIKYAMQEPPLFNVE